MDSPRRRARRCSDLRVACTRPERYEFEEDVQRAVNWSPTRGSSRQVVRAKESQRTGHECLPFGKPGIGTQESRDNPQ